MHLSLLVVRKYVPIRWCEFNRVKSKPCPFQSVVWALTWLSTWPASCELNSSWEALVCKSWNYDQRPSLAENPWKSNSRESARLALKSLTIPSHNNVEYRHPRVADILFCRLTLEYCQPSNWSEHWCWCVCRHDCCLLRLYEDAWSIVATNIVFVAALNALAILVD